MALRLAIHDQPGTFSDRWLEYCREHGLEHIRVNAYDSGIMAQLAGADGLLWHFSQGRARDLLMARHVLFSAQQMGLKVFPDYATCWHFDDKLAQKYLLEALGAPLVNTYAFYDLKSALAWVDQTDFPKVFKLRRGAGSANVRLVRTRGRARALARTSFGRGFKPVPGMLQDVGTRYAKVRRRRDLLGALRRLPRSVWSTWRANAQIGREKNYLYFQDFVPGNDFDIRVTVIGNRAFGFTRDVRPGDFRASGSGRIQYDLARVPLACVRSAFDVARKAGSQSMAFDFLQDRAGAVKIVEVSYGYEAKAVYDCEGHWDESLVWHPGHLWPQDAILEDLLAAIGRAKAAGTGS